MVLGCWLLSVKMRCRVCGRWLSLSVFAIGGGWIKCDDKCEDDVGLGEVGHEDTFVL